MNWKGELMQVLTFAVAPAIAAVAAWCSIRSERIGRWSAREFARAAILAWCVTRMGTHVVVFHVFGYAGGWDLQAVWVPIADAVLSGSDPSALVDNLYGPLYPYALAAGLWVGGGHAPATGLAFVVGDALALVLLHRIASRRLGTRDARGVVLFVLLSPLLWHGLIVRTQDEALLMCLLLLVQDCLDRRNERAAAVAAALGALLTKALFPLYAFPLLLAPGGTLRDHARRVGMAGGATIAALGLAVALGWDPRGREYGNLSVRGSSSWLLLGASEVSPAWFSAGLGVTAIACIAAAFGAWPRRPDEDSDDRAARGVSAVQSAFFVFSPFSLPSHMAHGLAHVGWHAVRQQRRARMQWIVIPFLAFQVVLTWLNPERWLDYPWLIALFVAWIAWVGFTAIAHRWSSIDRSAE